MIYSAPFYKNSLSPFFDTAKLILTVYYEDSQETHRDISNISTLDTVQKAMFIKELHPNVFICNAISWFWYNYLRSNNISIYPFMNGDIDTLFSKMQQNKPEKCVFFPF